MKFFLSLVIKNTPGLLLACLATIRPLLAQDVIVTEFMASNLSTNVAGQPADEFLDWIELHNPASSSVDLAGWHLSDDEAIPFKWNLPNITIPAGGYQIIFASGTGTPTNGTPHTNFKLSAQGGYLGLTRPDFSLSSEITYPQQFLDISFGQPDLGAPYHLANPTPGSINNNTEHLFVRDTQFDEKRGHYTTSFQVSITTETPSATIRYTTDGSEPQLLGNGTTYSSPLTINTTTVLRAKAFRSGYAPTNTDTQTYLFPLDVLSQTKPSLYPDSWGSESNADYEMDRSISLASNYTTRLLTGLNDLPSLSIATERSNLFGSAGIYSNPQNDNLDTNVSAEYFQAADNDGTNSEQGFQLDCAFKIQGGASRSPSSSIKHSFSLRFRKALGNSTLKFPLFSESPVDEFNSLQLRAVYNNSWIHRNNSQRSRATLMRDQWIRDSFIAMGQADGGHGDFVHLYLNGLYWGVYNLHERPDNKHYANYNGGDDDAIIGHNPSEQSSSFNTMRSIVANGSWTQIQGVLDIDSYLDYYLIQHFGHNDDLKGSGNWRASGGGSSGVLWRFYPWDSERVLENVSNTQALAVSQDGANIIDDLVTHEEFRIRFADRVQKHLFGDGALTSSRNLARWNARVAQLDNAIIAESARWGDDRRTPPYTRDSEWLSEVQNIQNNFFPSATPNRTSQMITKYQTETWPSGDKMLLDASAPVFEVTASPQSGGQVSPNDPIGFTAGEGTIYYTTDGTDPRQSGQEQGEEQDSPDLILFEESTPCSYLIPSNDSLGQTWTGTGFDDTSWATGASALGYDSGSGDYLSLISTNLGAMEDDTASCYVRIPFEIAQQSTLNNIQDLFLNLKFEDGFIIWLNGTRVSDFNGPSSPTWTSSSGVNRLPESGNILFTTFDLTANKDLLTVGSNLLAVQILNNNAQSSDLLFVPELSANSTPASGVSPSAIPYSAPFNLSSTATLRARRLVGSEWSPLVEANFLVESPATLGDLVVSELNYHPAPPSQSELAAGQNLTPPILLEESDFEYIVLLNLATYAINLDEISFASGIDYTFGPVVMQAGERIILARNPTAFPVRYSLPSGTQLLGPYSGGFKNSSETISYQTSDLLTLQSFTYDDGGDWPDRADGKASTLTLASPTTDPDLPQSWLASISFHGNPGAADIAPIARIKVNEILAHTDLPEVDAIELFNAGSSPIDLSHWYLSDDSENYFRFQIPNNTSLAAGAFITFDESDFNSSGTIDDFRLNSTDGETLYLIAATASGSPSAFVEEAEFGASLNGETLGRWRDGQGRLVPMSANTLGSTNSSPRLGPLVVTEVMFHPSSNAEQYEFIEVTNTADLSENLSNWTLRGDVDFDFPTGTILNPGESFVLVSFDPTDTTVADDFRANYGISNSIILVGPWSLDTLSNTAGDVRLRRADSAPPSDPANFPQVLEDLSDYLAVAPWPTTAAGNGDSLNRSYPLAYGSFPSSWYAATPSPGSNDTSSDPDGDGVSNILEYALGMNPTVPDRELLPSGAIENGSYVFRYSRNLLKSDISIKLESSFDLLEWSTLATFLEASSGPLQTRTATSVPEAGGRQFFRLKVN